MIELLPFLSAAGLYGLVVALVTTNPSGLVERAQGAGRYATQSFAVARKTSLGPVATGAVANQGRHSAVA
jgi:hypothetical protein